MSEMGLLYDWLAPSAQAARVDGVVIGLVTNNQDPDKLGRVKVKFPWLPKAGGKEAESDWARVLAPMAGADRGFYCLPEVDDEVLVAFEHGDLRFPYVIGALWNGKDKPPTVNSDGKNNVRMLKSRSGHIIRLDDSDSKEKIEIIDKSGKNSITISTAGDTITIAAKADIIIKSTNGKLVLSGQDVEITAKAGVTIEAKGPMKMKGKTVDIN